MASGSTAKWALTPVAAAIAACTTQVATGGAGAQAGTGAGSSSSDMTSGAGAAGGNGGSVTGGTGGMNVGGTTGSGGTTTSSGTTGSGGTTTSSGMTTASSGTTTSSGVTTGAGGAATSDGGGGASCMGGEVAGAPEGAIYLAVDSDYVYWTGANFNGSVWRAPQTGGTATLLSTSPPTDNMTAGLAVDDTSVYWANGDGGVYRASKTGGPASVLLPATADGAPSGFVVDDLYIYALASDASFTTRLVKVPKGGGSATNLAATVQPRSLAIDSTYVYWVDAGATVKSVPKGGGSVAPLSSYIGGVTALVADDSGVYGLDDSCNVMKFAQSPGTTQMLAQGKPGEFGCQTQIGVDATSLYWSATGFGTPSPSTVYSVPKAGGMQVPLLTCPAFQSSPGSGIAVDPTSLFWPANDPEVVLRLPK